jgi:predicted O-methyltransferase YrrM
MDKKWLKNFFSYRDLWPNRTGQSAIWAGAPFWGGREKYDEKKDLQNLNLGLGWLYYSLPRIYKPKLVVMIGSGRGFLPILIAKGLKDNKDKTACYFIDPSLDDAFWQNKAKTQKWFKNFGVEKIISHQLYTTQKFIKTPLYQKMKNIDLLVIDGNHFYNYVKFDFKSFAKKLSKNAIILFHDSISRSKNPQWNGPLKFLNELKKDKHYQFFDFKIGAGLTICQKTFYEQSPDYLKNLAQKWQGKKYQF